ncbi:hypothetical protein FF1_008991 [Malus domestica]
MHWYNFNVFNSLQMCHEHGLMHRDLKPEKILFENKKETAPLRAIDVGLSVFFKPGEVSSEIVGSSYYMAPEVLKRNYGPEVDTVVTFLWRIYNIWLFHDFKRDPCPLVSHYAKDLVKKMLVLIQSRGLQLRKF